MDKIQDLQRQIDEMKRQLSERTQNTDFVESIRNAIFVDVDSKSTTTQTATDTNGDTVTIGKIPNKYLRTYFRGQIINIPIYIPDIT